LGDFRFGAHGTSYRSIAGWGQGLAPQYGGQRTESEFELLPRIHGYYSLIEVAIESKPLHIEIITHFDERLAGHQDIVNARQVRTGLAEIPGSWLERLIVAYEPVWAIGTGKTATPQDAQDAHKQIRTQLAKQYGPDAANRVRIIYGGSVKPDVAADIFAMPDVDGGLIGGASLNAADFVTICKAAATSGRSK
jgi:hypothetical protein